MRRKKMGRIISRVKITNALDPSYQIECNALIDTGASGLVLPKAWKERLGKFLTAKIIEMETADQRYIDLKRLLSSREIESIVPYPLKGDLPL